MKSIVLIVSYFGKFPIWFDAFMLSCSGNPTITWIIVTDCELPQQHPENILFVKSSMDVLNEKINKIVGIKTTLNPYKLCDFKPVYGHIFQEFIKEYDFWGFCDVDIIWGNIRAFITEEILTEYDIISSRKEAVSGHFTILKNTEENMYLYQQIPKYKSFLEPSRFMGFDEASFTKYLKSAKDNDQLSQKVFWEKILLNEEKGRDSVQEYHLDRWLYESGNIFELKSKDNKTPRMYLHFMNWKKSMKNCEVVYSSKIEKFYVSYDSIHIRPHGKLRRIINSTKNLFYGYYIRRKLTLTKRKIGKTVRDKIQTIYSR